MADIELPADVGRTRHLTAQMHRSEDNDGDPIPEGYLLGADGARGHNWYDPSTFGGGTGLVPYYIPVGDTFTVPLYRQALFSEAIEVDGALVVNGLLLGVD